ncbi:TetR/AcrR family transcriptional regulator [Mycobacterium sp. UM_CSW]|uniref:TetR/AcrR family transcriptional regulator n=1 Tax=Mycobacterium sp. UM_CSW TaxID=1370119 RepID=UPI00040E245D|nr:TetR/AcrR family transcriptional regulator [Mycobacterium sp. UM_CSW]
MAGVDWLVGQDRGSEATARIHAAAADLVSERGWEGFTIGALAAKVHCSPATIYRHAGGRTAIRNAVVNIHAARVIESMRDAIEGLTGAERVVSATAIALQRIRSDPLTQMIRSTRPPIDDDWMPSSEVVVQCAQEVLGQHDPDPLAQQWLIHVFLALWIWPMKDAEAELQMLQRFLGPPYDAAGS